jgi:hypothetical protein
LPSWKITAALLQLMSFEKISLMGLGSTSMRCVVEFWKKMRGCSLLILWFAWVVIQRTISELYPSLLQLDITFLCQFLLQQGHSQLILSAFLDCEWIAIWAHRRNCMLCNTSLLFYVLKTVSRQDLLGCKWSQWTK